MSVIVSAPERKRGRVHLTTPRYSFVLGEDGRIYFLHLNGIRQGAKFLAPGVIVDFGVAPPLPNTKFPNAIDAIVGGTEQ